jgi:putative CocE/NonD family hydrolase
MGKNEWRYENEYPLARTDYRKLYFAGGGHANSGRGDGRLTWKPPLDESKADQYTYDPAHPVNSSGGAAGQQSLEKRDDILVYTSEALSDALEVTGPVKVVLFGSSDAPDTDFVARLIDVFPDGRALSMASGILRARYRSGTTRPALLQPGGLVELPIDLIGTSNVFAKGHRIRVDVTSSDFPAFDRHLKSPP